MDPDFEPTELMDPNIPVDREPKHLMDSDPTL
jgi:hypothetical protein